MARHMEQTLRTLFAQLSTQYRWKGLDDPQRESIAEHMFKQNFFCQLMLAMEQYAGNPHGLDFYRILACCNTHDYGEGPAGDTPRTEKTEADDDREAAAFEDLMDELIPDEIRKYFPQPLDRSAPENDINRQFWDQCEQVGYLVYSSFEVANNQNHQQCIDGHLEKLLQSKFSSVHWMLRLIGLAPRPT